MTWQKAKLTGNGKKVHLPDWLVSSFIRIHRVTQGTLCSLTKHFRHCANNNQSSIYELQLRYSTYAIRTFTCRICCNFIIASNPSHCPIPYRHTTEAQYERFAHRQNYATSHAMRRKCATNGKENWHHVISHAQPIQCKWMKWMIGKWFMLNVNVITQCSSVAVLNCEKVPRSLIGWIHTEHDSNDQWRHMHCG